MADEDPFQGDEYRRGFCAGVTVGAVISAVLAIIGFALSLIL